MDLVPRWAGGGREAQCVPTEKMEHRGLDLGFDQNQVRAHALPDVAVAPDRASYPVLVFSPMGSPPHSYTALLFQRYPKLRLAVSAEKVC